ncbi:unnamed protein product [Brassicogethes aeneus]|uniref:Osiris 19 n=1 Tax=Brassicogethes aeneus TaxID=1431903 RepID=A0A9P0B5P1_BRAAE|nr:unnamed protein product [Brassicogethes aeneus]
MAFFKVCVTLAVVGLACASPAKHSLFSNMDETRSLCAEDDPIACLKLKAITFLDTILSKDNFQMENVEVNKNSYRSNEITSRGDASIEDHVEEYIKGHDATFKLPVVGAVTVEARNLDNDEINFKVNYNNGVQEARKSKLKKIFIPILVFVLLKAMTLVPLALGVLGLKAWNALQLSFLSFVVSVGLAIFQLCKKIAADSAHPQISAHGPWEAQAYASQYRSLDGAQDMAYSAYAPQ